MIIQRNVPVPALGSERVSCPRRTRGAMLRLLARGVAGPGPSLLMGTARGTSCAREPAGGPCSLELPCSQGLPGLWRPVCYLTTSGGVAKSEEMQA